MMRTTIEKELNRQVCIKAITVHQGLPVIQSKASVKIHSNSTVTNNVYHHQVKVIYEAQYSHCMLKSTVMQVVKHQSWRLCDI